MTHSAQPGGGRGVRAPRPDDELRSPLDLVHACRLRLDEPIIDVSGNDSSLMQALLEAGHTDLTFVDSATDADAALSKRYGERSRRIKLLRQDVTRFHPQRRYALWYDEALFHSFTHPEERRQYVEALLEALRPEGHLVIRTFGPEEPGVCARQPVMGYSAATLNEELGKRFELIEHFLTRSEAACGERHQFLHCRFRRHAAP